MVGSRTHTYPPAFVGLVLSCEGLGGVGWGVGGLLVFGSFCVILPCPFSLSRIHFPLLGPGLA
jgi:hypothetical protein